MSDNQRDIRILRDLAKQYAEIAHKPIQEERRRLWAAHFSLKRTRPLIMVSYGLWNAWCREEFGGERMQCQDPFHRYHETVLRMAVFQDSIGDDTIIEPWFTQHACVRKEFGCNWGLKEARHDPGDAKGAWKFDPPIKDWRDAAKLRARRHEVDEEETERNVSRLHDAVGDILPIDVPRIPAYYSAWSDISTNITRLRGFEALMLDMYEHPEELHALLAFMRDGILANNQEAEDAGHYTLTAQTNQAMTYSEEFEWPKPNSGPRKRKDLWNFCAAQEFTLISPEFHYEFMLKYQAPVYEKYGLVHYGCCEDLTRKIDLLRQLKNLRSIGVGPTADVAKCAEQIGADYAISWRPNPTDQVSSKWDEDRVRRIMGEGLEACKGGYVHIHLKDVETVCGDPTRLHRWARIVRDLAENYA